MVSSDIKKRIQWLQALGAKSFSLPYKSIPGVISTKALEEHLKLYEGYKDLLARIDEKFETMGKDEVPKKHMPDHPFRALKEAETYALGGVLLHELYFTNITNKPAESNGLEIEKFIKEQFGSMAEWRHCMRGSAMETRGWVVFTCDQAGDYRILMMDSHDHGGAFDQTPLVVVDCYEHAYWMDHGVDRATYVDGVLKHLNWEEINRRYLAR
jgi:Fe-Mn family superoxide dismutase